MDTTTIFTNTALNTYGIQWMNALIASVVTLTAITVVVMTGVFAFAGICRRVR